MPAPVWERMAWDRQCGRFPPKNPNQCVHRRAHWHIDLAIMATHFPPRDALQGKGHLPFQILDASAIKGIRGLAGESSSIYNCIQIYKDLTPPCPPAYRGATEGPGPPSYVGSSEERPCPDLGLCAPPSAPAGAGAAVGGWAPPPPDDCTCRVKPKLKSPPLARLPAPCAARGVADGLPHVLPCPPVLHCCAPVPVLPAHGGRGGGCAAPGERGATLSLTLALPLTPLTQSSSLWLPLQHSMPCSTLALCCPRSYPAAPCCPCSLRGGEASRPCPARSRPAAPCCSRSRGGGRSPCVPSARAAAVSAAEMEPKTSTRLARPHPCPLPPPRDVPMGGGGAGDVVAGCAASGGARSHRPPRGHEARATEAVRPWLGL